MSAVYLEPGQSGETLRTTFNSLVDAVGATSLTGKKLAILGDSQDVASWESTAISTLNLDSVINMAKAGAAQNDTGSTAVNVQTYGSVPNDNVLSNQVRALIRDSFTTGATITWTHPITGFVTSIDSGLGVGLGNTPPDLIYMKFGQNGGEGALTDSDFNTVIGQTYGDLTRLNQFSALRWAIETLMIVFPDVPIFVATPLQSSTLYSSLKTKSDQTIRMAKYMNCPVINMYEELGIVSKLEPGKYTYDGIHPGWPGGGGNASTYDGRVLMGRFISNRIRQYYIERP